MIGVLIIPTGLGAAIGGNAGDGNPVAKLIAQCCDTLITHPNVVNASDINEMTENTWYVDGYMLDRFLRGEIQLQSVRRYNRILVVANPPLTQETVNAVAAARATIGIDAKILVLSQPLRMMARFIENQATGDVSGVRELLRDVQGHDFDALAIHTPVEVSREVQLDYLRNGGVNPWGGVEAKVSRLIAEAVKKPVAHAPLDVTTPDDVELAFICRDHVPPRIAAEAISNCHLHSVLKGLHRAPRIGTGLSRDDVDFLLSPHECWGIPHEACISCGIPIITVRENTLRAQGLASVGERRVVDNYLEAAGLIMSMRAGVHPASVRKDLTETWTQSS